jgi:hypothetical protein
MRRISIFAMTAICLSVGPAPYAGATEPALNFFDTVKFPEMLQNDVYKMKCSITWDANSKFTEIISRCNKPNNEVYAHGNATSKGGDNAKYNAGPISYLSFTVKSVDAYKNFPMYGQMCAGAVYGVQQDGIKETMAWIEANYKGLTRNKKISKKFNGHEVSIIGGTGATRTLTCGAKPRK